MSQFSMCHYVVINHKGCISVLSVFIVVLVLSFYINRFTTQTPSMMERKIILNKLIFKYIELKINSISA